MQSTKKDQSPAVNLSGPWTVNEFASLYRVSRASVYNWISRGWLGSAKIGGSRRILPEHDAAFKQRLAA